MSARVLFTSWPFEGHVFPLLSIALAERERGGEVAFYTGRKWSKTLASQSVEPFAFDRVEGVWERVHVREQAARGRRQSLRVSREAFRDWLVDSIPAQVADLREVIDRWHPDVIVTDGTMWGPSLILREAEPIPVAYASTLLYALIPGREVPVPGLRFRPPRTRAERALAMAGARMIDWLARDTRLRLDQHRASYGLKPLGCSVNESMARMPLYLIGSVPELDLRRTDLPSNVRYVGPLVWHPAQSSETEQWLDGVPTGRPWVHVTEGTSHYQDPFVLRAAAAGLPDADVEAILTTGPDREPKAIGLGSTAPNVHVARWLSHTELLPRCAAVVTTGGAQTIVAALRAGVPLVIVPTGWDKAPNAMRVSQAGVAVSLSPRQCTPDRLRSAVHRVLADPAYRKAAHALAERFAAAPGPCGATELVEELGRSKLAATSAGASRSVVTDVRTES
jgi:MGT family glycosyltransferase